MKDSKWVMKSMTIWGEIVAAVLLIWPAVNDAFFGTSITVGDLTGLSDAVETMIGAIGGLISAVLVVWGRVRAKTSLVLKPSEATV